MRNLKLLLWMFIFIAGSTFAEDLAEDKVTALPGLRSISDTEYAGYATDKQSNKLFYWFVASHSPKSPIIIWSNGGPGYTSLYGFFDETGPYKISTDLQLSARKQAWSRFANDLVIEQPAGTGLSDTPGNKIPTSPQQGINQYFEALQYFFKLHPEYKNSPIYLSGESYAGTYLPLLSQKILNYNKTTSAKINLKGLILISPWADPIAQQSMDTAYAYYHGLITARQKEKLDQIYQQCNVLTKSKNSSKANIVCGKIHDQIKAISNRYLINIAYKSSGDNGNLRRYLMQPAVLRAIHATQSPDFKNSSEAVSNNYNDYIQVSMKSIYNQLLTDKLPIIIFSGLNDAKDTNFLGMQKFIASLSWPQKINYVKSERIAIMNPEITHLALAYQKSGGYLTWITVLDAGHMVPQDQPDINMIVKNFIESPLRSR